MKAWKIFIGLGLILTAALLILDALCVITPLAGIFGSVSVFKIIAGLFIVALIIERIVRGKATSIFFLLAFLFIIFEENIAYVCHLESGNIINNWLVLLIALLFTAGFAILLPHNRKKHRVFQKTSTNGDYTENSLCSSSVYVDCATFTPSHIENNLGSCSVHFENVDKYEGGKTLHIENNLGAMTVNVPTGWIVRTTIENNLGACGTNSEDAENTCGPILYINGENNLGSLSVEYI